MNKHVIFCILFFINALSLSAHWKSYKTEHFIIFYQRGTEKQAFHLLQILEFYRPKVEKLTGNSKKQVPIVIEDIGTISNGLADPVFNRIRLFQYSPDIGEIGFTQNWWSLVGVHEYTHMMHLTKTGGIPQGLSFLFGNIFAPNILSPGWITEGIAVYSESQLSLYQGRLNDGYYDNYIMACVKDKRLPSLIKATYSPLEFPYYTGIYLFGGEFFNYLSYAYGEEKFAQFFDVQGSSIFSYATPVLPFISLDLHAKQVYGKSFNQLWEEWLQFVKEQKQNDATEKEQITYYGWTIKELKLYKNKLFFIRSYPVKTDSFSQFYFNEIIERNLENNEEKVMVSTTSSFLPSLQFHNNQLYYAVYDIKRGYHNSYLNTFGYYSIIYKKDLITGNTIKIVSDDIRAYSVISNGNMIYSKDKQDEFGSMIYFYNVKTKKTDLLFTTAYLVNEIIIDSTKIIVSARRDWENFNLYFLDLNNKMFIPLMKSPYFQAMAHIYDNKLFFTENKEKQYEVFSYDLNTQKFYQLTNNHFACYPAYDEKKQILYFVGLNSYGFDIYKQPAQWKAYNEPAYVPFKIPEFTLKRNELKEGGYGRNLLFLIPSIRLPLIYFDQDQTLLGIGFIGADAIGHFDYTSTILYNQTFNRYEFNINVSHKLFTPLNSSVFYEYNNENEFELEFDYPFYRSLKSGISVFGLGTFIHFFNDFHRIEWEPFLYTGLQFPYYQNSLRIFYPVENEKWGSTLNRTSLYLDFYNLLYVYKSQIDFLIKGIYNFDNYFEELSLIRGYKESLWVKNGMTLAFNYSIPLLQLRTGLWNPNIFFEDIITTIFVDSALAKYEDTQLSTGIELKLESKIVFELPMTMGIRYSFNKEEESMLNFFVKSVWVW